MNVPRIVRVVITALLLASAAVCARAEEKPIITVLDLQIDQVSPGEMRAIISLLSSALFRTDRFTVIDVSERETLLEEIEFSTADCTDENCQLQIGKQLAAEFIVVGSIGKLGKLFVLSVKLLETSTARTVSTADGLYESIDEVAKDIGNIAETLADIPGLAGPGQVAATAPAAAAEKAGQPTPPVAEAPEETEAAQAEPAEQPVAQPAEPRPRAGLSDRKKVAIGLLAGGGVLGGGGAFLIRHSFDFLNSTVDDAFQEYYTATSGADFDGLYAAYLEELGSFRFRFFAGVGASVLGAGLLVTGAVLLFTDAPAEEGGGVAVLLAPRPSGAVVSVHCRY